MGEEEIKKLNALVHRYKHVKPEFDTTVGECKPEEIRMWAARRQRLVEHYNLLGSKDVQWLATAASSRVRPHLLPGFTSERADGDDEEVEEDEGDCLSGDE